MPQLGPAYDLAARLKTLEDQVRRMAANQLGQAFSATQSDGSVGMSILQATSGSGATVMRFYQGAATPRDPNTGMHPLLAYLGEVVLPDGTPEDSAFILFRTNGQEVLSVDGGTGFELFDGAGNVVVAPDETAGAGLAGPWLALPAPAPAAVGSWPKTAATTMTTIAESEFRAHHAKVWWSAQAYCDTGSTGQVQLAILDGGGNTAATGPAHAVASGAFVSASDTLALPSGFWGQSYTVQVQAQVTSGTGNVYAQTYAVYGRQS